MWLHLRRRLSWPLLFIAAAAWAQGTVPEPPADAPAADTLDEAAKPPEEAAPEEKTPTDELPAEQAAQLRDAFDSVALQENATAARTIIGEIDNPAITENAWHAFYVEFFATRAFTAGHAAFWEFALREGGIPAGPARAPASCRFAFEAVAAAARKTPPDYESLGRALAWLDRAGPAVAGPQMEAVAEALREAFTPPLELGLLLAPPGTPGLQAAIQAALSLSPFLPPPAFVKFVILPGTGGPFYARHGVFLFDGGALDEAQLQSLGSLLAAFPPQLHAAIAVLVPDGLGANAAQLGLVTSRPILEIAPLPMEVTSNPGEFIPRVGQTAAPEFTLAAATQLLRIIQRVQFTARPDLALRRDALLARAGPRRERYLRRTIAPELYLSNLDELLPLTGYLWILDSARAFHMAMELLDIRLGEAADALLLLADMLSGGGGSTLLFRTDALGRVSSQETPLRRVLATPDLAYVTGLGVDGTLWAFQLNVRGGAVRCFRE